MAKLSWLAAALSLGLTSPADVQVGRWEGEIAKASIRFGIPEEWIRRVMAAESGGRTRADGRPIISPKGAMGLMQLMPETWAEMRLALGLGADPFDPHDNIIAGTGYLRSMYDRFGHPGLFAAYNAGPGRYADHLRDGRRLPLETVRYVTRVIGPAQEETAPRAHVRTGAPSLFVVRRSVAEIQRVGPQRRPVGSLFAMLAEEATR